MARTLLYAQSGGVTAVINQSAAAAIVRAQQSQQVDCVLAARNGISGVLHEQLYDCSGLNCEPLYNSPGAYFGSCRFKLPARGEPQFERVLQRIIDVFAAHEVRYFLYNGGGDSQDSLLKISEYAAQVGYPLICMGIPKTIDNDLPVTDSCPGFGSAAKYVATSMLEAASDMRSMSNSSSKVLIMEVMGRNCGWLTAATALSGDVDQELRPDVLLMPEAPVGDAQLLSACAEAIASKGFCLIAAAEGVRPGQTTTFDAFGHPQLGGTAANLAQLVRGELGVKTHCMVSGYLQRSARHLISATDADQAQAVARAAVEAAEQELAPRMITLERVHQHPYRWRTGACPLEQVANKERALPADYLSGDGLQVSSSCLEYLRPLIVGEQTPPFHNGLPDYSICREALLGSRVAPWSLG